MSELRTEAALLVGTLESRLLELRSLIPAPAADTAAPGEAVVPADPAVAADPAAAPGCPHCGAPAGASTAAPTGAVGTSCTGCPLCTLMAVLRGERPDLAGALLDGAVTALQMVRALVSEPPGPDGAAAEQPEADPHGTATPAGDQPAADQPAADQSAADPESVPIPGPASPAAAQRRPPERIRIS